MSFREIQIIKLSELLTSEHANATCSEGYDVVTLTYINVDFQKWAC